MIMEDEVRLVWELGSAAVSTPRFLWRELWRKSFGELSKQDYIRN